MLNLTIICSMYWGEEKWWQGGTNRAFLSNPRVGAKGKGGKGTRPGGVLCRGSNHWVSGWISTNNKNLEWLQNCYKTRTRVDFKWVGGSRKGNSTGNLIYVVIHKCSFPSLAVFVLRKFIPIPSDFSFLLGSGHKNIESLSISTW